MSSRITEKINCKQPSLYNDTFLYMVHSKSEAKEKNDSINEFNCDSIFYDSMQSISQISETKKPNEKVLNALKELKNAIDKLSDRVEKQNFHISQIITAEEVQRRLEVKYKSVKEMKKKNVDSKCYIF